MDTIHELDGSECVSGSHKRQA